MGAAAEVFRPAFGVVGQIPANAQAHGLAVEYRTEAAEIEQPALECVARVDLPDPEMPMNMIVTGR